MDGLSVASSASQLLFFLIALPLIGAGMYTDVRSRRISNRLNLVLAASGLILHGIVQGRSGVWNGAAGLGTGLAVMVLLYAVGAIGAGDAKFMAAVGAWLGPAGAVYAIAAGCLLAGLFAAIEIVRSRHRRLYLTNLALIADKFVSGRLLDGDAASHEILNQNRVSMPFGAFLGAGGLGVLLGRAFGIGI